MFRKKIKENSISLPQEQGYVSEALSLRDAMNRLFDESVWDPFDILERGHSLSSRGADFPKVDITESKDSVTVVADIPGMNPEKVAIEVEDDYLSLSGMVEREDEVKDEEKRYYRFEREYGQFSREFVLPARVDRSKVTAKAKDGVLTIILPKLEEEKKDIRTRVPIDVE